MRLIYERMLTIMTLVMVILDKLLIEAAPKTSNFDFQIPQRGQRAKLHNNAVAVEYFVAETWQNIDMKCREGEDQSTWTMTRTHAEVVTPFQAQPSSAGEYVCPTRKVHLLLSDAMKFSTTTGANVKDSVKLSCGMIIHTGQRSFLLNLTIFDFHGEVLGNHQILTANVSTKIEVNVDTKKPQIDDLLSPPYVSSFTCRITIFNSAGDKNLFELMKPLTVKLYSPLSNVKPNTTRTSLAQAVRCTSDGVPPAHRYVWKLYDRAKEFNFEKPLYIASGHILKIFDEGNYTFICTAFNIMGKKEYSLSWVGNLYVAGSSPKRGERNIELWIAGGSVATIVVLVVIVSFSRR